jgi:hypothetical protein
MKGDDYLNHFVLPNFYFHVTAAFAFCVIAASTSASATSWVRSL